MRVAAPLMIDFPAQTPACRLSPPRTPYFQSSPLPENAGCRLFPKYRPKRAVILHPLNYGKMVRRKNIRTGINGGKR